MTVDASDGEYEEIGDILNRHATLVDTNKDLKSQVRIAEVDVRSYWRHAVGTGKASSDGIGIFCRQINCGKNSGSSRPRRKTSCSCRTAVSTGAFELCVDSTGERLFTGRDISIGSHQQHLESLRTEAFKLDVDRQRSDRISNDRSRESGQIVMTVTNLYNRCRLSLGDKLPVLREQDMDIGQYMHSLLKVIASRIIDLDYIVSSHKEQVTEQLHCFSPSTVPHMSHSHSKSQVLEAQ
jgi:hypothetical protein